MLTSKKTLKPKKVEMTNKIYGENVFAPKNGLRMQDVPLKLYTTLIHIVLRSIMNHHKWDIPSDCMKLIIHWVEYMAKEVPPLLAKKLHVALQERTMKRVKFSYPSTLREIINLYQPSVV